MSAEGASDPTASAADFFRRLAAFETPDLLSHRFRFQGILMWPAVRWTLVSRSLETHFGFLPTNAPSSPLSRGEKVAYLAAALRWRPLAGIRPCDVLWFGSALGVVPGKDGRWLGRVNDYLVNAHPEGTLLIEDSHQKRFKRPRGVPRLRYHDWIRIRAAVLSRFSRLSGPPAEDRESVGAFLARLRATAPVPLAETDYARMESDLLRLAARLPHYHASYAALFARARPRLVFLEDACYGSQAYILKWAKDAGIATAEFQHGVVVPSHPAYNYGPAGFDPAYRPYLPDHILTHGEFWYRGIRVPAKAHVVGNPHFSTKLAERSGGAARRAAGRKALIVSQADVTDRLVALAHDLRRRDPGLEITFRLHPAEAGFQERYRSLEGLPGVAISKSGDIYDLIDGSDWIVGVSSTVLFEAVGLRRPVFVYDTPQARLYIPETFGTWFRDAADLLGRLALPAEGAGIGTESVWATGWRDNYRRFLEAEAGVPVPSSP